MIDIAAPDSVMGAAGAPDDQKAYVIPGSFRDEKLYVDRLHPSGVGYARGISKAVADGLKRVLGL